jgi:hypothetical protein
MASRTRLATTTGVLLPVLLLGALTACGPETTEPASGGSAGSVESESPEPTEKGPSEPTESAEEPSEEPSAPSEGGDGSVTGALLPAADVPGFNDQFTWEELATDTREPQDLAGTCHKFEMTSIGAEEVAYRTYQPTQGDNSTASELVAAFPDDKTATRAYEVLKSWQADCAAELRKFDRVSVGDLEPVSTDAGEGTWYLLIYGPAAGDPDEGYFDAQGIAKVGDRIAVLRLSLIGQDYNYAAGEEPMVAAVQAAAGRL